MEIGMVKQPFFYLMLGTVMLGLASSPVLAQSSGSGGSGGSGSDTTGAASGPSGTDTPTSTGEAATSGTGSSEQNCPPSQMWNAQSMACENK
jgi:hypothetical protein